MNITHVSEVPLETLHTMATCQTLVNLDDELIGDPLEKATLQAIDWTLTKNDVVICKKPNKIAASAASSNSSSSKTSTSSSSSIGWKIYQRFHFSSALKRMSVIAGHTRPGSADTNYIATCKGAPEILKSMIRNVPSNYDDIYLHYAREGARVLCLGYNELGILAHQELRDLKREDVEKELTFVGFVVISCPLKPDSKSVVREILHASHHITMITGDNPLTACHVASQLKMIDKKYALVLTRKNDANFNATTTTTTVNDANKKNVDNQSTTTTSEWCWKSIVDDKLEKNIHFAIDQLKYYKLKPKKSSSSNTDSSGADSSPSYYYLCLTGEGFEYLFRHENELLKRIIASVKVFARVSPKQKEFVVTMLKSLGYVALVCGEGTNDVGAL